MIANFLYISQIAFRRVDKTSNKYGLIFRMPNSKMNIILYTYLFIRNPFLPS